MSEFQGNNNGVLIYNGREYAVGLHWFTGGVDFGNKALARQRAGLVKGDFFGVRTNVSQQHGIGFLNKGHKHNMPVAAPMAADRLVGQWHGIFEADNGWWYLQVFSDAIAPHGDIFFYDEEEARACLRDNMDSQTWAHTYAPDSWDIAWVSREVTLDTLLGNKSVVNLQSASMEAFFGSKSKMMLAVTVIMAGAAALVLGALFALGMFDTAPPPPPKPRTVVKPRPVRPQQVIVNQKLSLPAPSQVLKACGEAVERIVRPIPGWPLQTVECQGEIAIISWQQRRGSLQMARNEGRRIPSDAVVTVDGREMQATVGFAKPPVFTVERWMRRNEAVFDLERRFSRIGFLKMEIVIPEKPVLGRGGDRRRARSNVNQGAAARRAARDGNESNTVQNVREIVYERPFIEVSLKTPSAPRDIATLFDISGLEIVSAIWNIRGGTWEYNAKLTLDYVE